MRDFCGTVLLEKKFFITEEQAVTPASWLKDDYSQSTPELEDVNWEYTCTWAISPEQLTANSGAQKIAAETKPVWVLPHTTCRE